jgi:hypothetical protein
MNVHPFFRLKITVSMLCFIEESTHRCKNTVFRSGGFCYDSASNRLTSVGTSHSGWGDHWHIAAITARYAIYLKMGHSKIRQNLLALAYRAKPLGISCCDSHDKPTVTPTIVRMATVGELEADS